MTTNYTGWVFERLIVGDLMVNCYILGCAITRKALVVDPGDDGEFILGRLKNLNLDLIAVVNTHGHGDHIGANRVVSEEAGAPIWIGKDDAPMLGDPWANLSAPFGMSVVSPAAHRLLHEGDVLDVGERRLKVLHTPGHSLGSVTLAGDEFAICGDLVFQGSIGRTDFPGGDLELLLRMVRKKIYPLGDDCVLYPGHGPETTIGIERRTNPFLQPGFSF